MSRNYYRRVSNTIVVATPSTETNATGGTETTQVTYFMNTNGQENQNVENSVVLMDQIETTSTSTGSDGDADFITMTAINATIEYLQANNITGVGEIEAEEVDSVRIEGDRIFSGGTDITNIFIDNTEFAQEQEKYEELIIDFDGQTEWTLNEPVNAPEKTELFVNGIKADYLGEFTVSGNVITWLDAHYIIETTDDLEVIYK